MQNVAAQRAGLSQRKSRRFIETIQSHGAKRGLSLGAQREPRSEPDQFIYKPRV